MSNVREKGDELSVEAAESKEGPCTFMFAGGDHSWMALSLTGSICIPPFPTIILRYSTSSAKNVHLSSLRTFPVHRSVEEPSKCICCVFSDPRSGSVCRPCKLPTSPLQYSLQGDRP